MTDAELLASDGAIVVPIEVREYPNGDPLVTHDAYPFDRILLRPRSIQVFMAALWWVDALRERGHRAPELILPAMPGMRQDRLSPEGDYLFTAKSVAREINLRGFPTVTLVDPHSMVTPALVDRARVMDTSGYASSLRLKEGYVGVISPDAGAEKRAQKWASAMKVPLFHAWKSRDIETGAISGFGVEPLKKGHYLVVDDICDRGGTFLGLADLIDEAGATADLFTTHGYYTAGTEPLAARYRRLFCTDSTLGDKGCATVLPLCAHLLQEP